MCAPSVSSRESGVPRFTPPVEQRKMSKLSPYSSTIPLKFIKERETSTETKYLKKISKKALILVMDNQNRTCETCSQLIPIGNYDIHILRCSKLRRRDLLPVKPELSMDSYPQPNNVIPIRFLSTEKSTEGISGEGEIVGNKSDGEEWTQQGKATSNEWECPSCTMRNANVASECVVCNTTLTDLPSVRETIAGPSRDNLILQNSDETWVCPLCTLRNEHTSQSCAACGTVSNRGGDYDQSHQRRSEGNSGWACPTCTLSNPNSVSECSACNNFRSPLPSTRETLIGEPHFDNWPSRGPASPFIIDMSNSPTSQRRSNCQSSVGTSSGDAIGSSAIMGGLGGLGLSILSGERSSRNMLRNVLLGASAGAATASLLRRVNSPVRSGRACDDEEDLIETRATGMEPNLEEGGLRGGNGEGRRRTWQERIDVERIDIDTLFRNLLMGQEITRDHPLFSRFNHNGALDLDGSSYEQLLEHFPMQGRGLSQSTVDNLPVHKYEDSKSASSNIDSSSSCSPSSAFEKERNGCNVCLENFEAGDELKLLPCFHRFHVRCIDKWLLQERPTCPTCKFEINL